LQGGCGEPAQRRLLPIRFCRLHDASLLRSNAMSAFNTVRFRVKPGREQDFLDAHEECRRLARS
jgi:hypothetical protein